MFFEAVVSISVLVLQLLCLFWLSSYELFLQGHQAAALAASYALWKHTSSGLKLPGLYVYISISIFLATSVLQCLVILYQNISFCRGCSQALISKHLDTVRVTIDVVRPLNIRAGQYVNIWISLISFWSFLQSHPFMIALWRMKEGVFNFDLLIESRRGFMQKLFACAKYYREHLEKKTSSETIEQNYPEHAEDYQRSLKKSTKNITQLKFSYKDYKDKPQVSDFCLMIISEPHGSGISVSDYRKILMIITEFSIAAQLPYLKELVHEFNSYQVWMWEIQLVWQLQSFGRCLCSKTDEVLMKP